MNPRSPRQLLFKPLFRFRFVFALQYLDCYYYEYAVKQMASLYLKLSLEAEFFSVFLLFLEK